MNIKISFWKERKQTLRKVGIEEYSITNLAVIRGKKKMRFLWRSFRCSILVHKKNGLHVEFSALIMRSLKVNSFFWHHSWAFVTRTMLLQIYVCIIYIHTHIILPALEKELNKIEDLIICSGCNLRKEATAAWSNLNQIVCFSFLQDKTPKNRLNGYLRVPVNSSKGEREEPAQLL